MKITGSNQIQSKSVRKTSKKSGAGSAGFSRALASETEEASESSSVVTAGPITAVDALLSVQEVPDAATGRSKGLGRASDMIDMLEEIRKGLLLGSIPMGNLRGLADMARGRKETVGDPNLSAILEEIELRAEVELAKLGV